MGSLPEHRNEPLRSQPIHRRATSLNLHEAEEVILEEPYAKAVLRVEGNYGRRDVLLAVRTLQRRMTHLNAESLLLELMDKDTVQPDPNVQTEDPTPRKGGACKRPASDCCRSDGDMEAPCKYLDASLSPEDLQDDGGGTAVSMSISGEGAEPGEPPRKKKSGQEPAPPSPTDRARTGTLRLKRRLQMLRKENRQLRSRKVCRQCKERTVSITFLPCGHLCFCYQCGQGFQTCPLCLKTILADVRTFLC